MKKTVCKILLGLGCIVILCNNPHIFFTHANVAISEEKSYNQIDPSILCITPYHDGFPFED